MTQGLEIVWEIDTKSPSAVGGLALEDWKRIRGRFIDEAIKEWDRVGEGRFDRWVEVQVQVRWYLLGMSN